MKRLWGARLRSISSNPLLTKSLVFFYPSPLQGQKIPRLLVSAVLSQIIQNMHIEHIYNIYFFFFFLLLFFAYTHTHTHAGAQKCSSYIYYIPPKGGILGPKIPKKSHHEMITEQKQGRFLPPFGAPPGPPWGPPRGGGGGPPLPPHPPGGGVVSPPGGPRRMASWVKKRAMPKARFWP